jgi:ATP-binding cassette, subfamily B, bacterial
VIATFMSRKEVQFFRALTRAAPGLGRLWWAMLILRAVLPTVISVAFGWLIGSITQSKPLTGPLLVAGFAFGALMVLLPLHQMVSTNLGSRLAAHLMDRLIIAGVSPDGIGHLEDPELTNDLTTARDFDAGIMGPPLAISIDFIVSGLLDLMVGVVASIVLFWFAWWAPFVVIAAWISTHWLLRESGVWKDRNTDEVRLAQRHADYSYRLAVDASPAKEVRFFGLAGWVIDRFVSTRTKLYSLQYEATKLREKSVLLCLAVVLAGNVAVFWAIAAQARSGNLSEAQVVVFVQAAIGAASIAFGGLNWALDGASAPVAALTRLEAKIPLSGALRSATAQDGTQHLAQPVAAPTAAATVEFKNVSFSYPAESDRFILHDFNLTIPAGTSLAIVGQNGAGKTTLAKLLCRLYDPTVGEINVSGTDLRDLSVAGWRSHVTAVFQDYVRFDRSLRINVAPLGAPDEVIRAALHDAGGDELAGGNLDTILSKAYPGGTDLSGGQWQRVAIARALCAVRLGAGLVLLDEPTAQLDVRGESEIFERVLQATTGCTTVLISHRFSTVRLADRICVIEQGRVVELGTHDELMALQGRYQTMFDLQAARFTEVDELGQEVSHETL